MSKTPESRPDKSPIVRQAAAAPVNPDGTPRPRQDVTPRVVRAEVPLSPITEPTRRRIVLPVAADSSVATTSGSVDKPAGRTPDEATPRPVRASTGADDDKPQSREIDRPQGAGAGTNASATSEEPESAPVPSTDSGSGRPPTDITPRTAVGGDDSGDWFEE